MTQPTYCLHCGLKTNRPGGCQECGPDACGLEVPIHPHYLPPGTLLNHGQYQVGRVLGAGGFGVTYLAVDVRLGMRLAIKELLPVSIAARSADGIHVSALSQSAVEPLRAGMDGFLREAQSLIPFNEHPNIVSIINFFEENGTAYLAMPYLDGIPLDLFIENRGGKLTQEDALPIILSVLDALSATHQEHLLHRDIKPSNIFITAEGMVKLLDFGSARHVVGERTKTMTAVVTEGYAPFEQYQSKTRQGPFTDIYAVGATLYRMLVGETPMPALMRLANDTLQAPHRIPGVHVSERISQAIMCAMAVKPEGRFQNARAFLGALQAGEADAALGPAVAPAAVEATRMVASRSAHQDVPKSTGFTSKTSSDTRPPLKRNKPVLIAVAAIWAIIAVLGVAYLLFMGDKKDASSSDATMAETGAATPRIGIMSSERPFTKDVNGDGVFDFIGRYREFDYIKQRYVVFVVAWSGKDLQELWRSAPVGEWPEQTGILKMFRVDDTVLLAANNALYAYTIADGEKRWEAQLPGVILHMEQVDKAVRIQSDAHTFSIVQLATGRVTTDKDKSSSDSFLRSDEGRFQETTGTLDLRDNQWPTMATKGAYCPVENRIYDSALSQMDAPYRAVGCNTDLGVAYVIRATGTKIPYLVGYHRINQVKEWQVQVTPPGTTKTLSSEPRLHFDGEDILASYVIEGKTTAHLLSRTDGTERWRTPLPDPHGTNLGGSLTPTHAFVHNGRTVYLLDRNNGEVIASVNDMQER